MISFFSKLSPFLFFFQDPSTVFAYHLIYTHNIIHWYLFLVFGFVSFMTFSVLSQFSWHRFGKSRGLYRYYKNFNFFFSKQLMLWFFANSWITVWIDKNKWENYNIFLYRRDIKRSYGSFIYFYSPLLSELIEQDIPGSVAHKDAIFDENSWPKVVVMTNYYFSMREYILLQLLSYEEIQREDVSLAKNYSGWPSWWVLHNRLDYYLNNYISKAYILSEDSSSKILLSINLGNESRKFEYSCVIIPTTIVLIILAHSLSLIYSGSEEITPGLYFTAVGHQWFWSYEIQSQIERWEKFPLSFDFSSLLKEVNWDKMPPFPLDFTPLLKEVKWDEIILPPADYIPLLKYVDWEKVNLRSHREPSVIFLDPSTYKTFDSIPVMESQLSIGSKRLLEVDKPLVIPMYVPIRALATSGDVLHSWAVPEMGVKIDAVPGRINDTLVLAQRPGIFYGQCSELCGVGHGFMPIMVEAVGIEAFSNWLKQDAD